MMFLLALVGIAIICFFIWALRSDAQLQKDAEDAREHQKRQEERESAYKAKQEAYENAKEAALAEMKAKWGRCTKDIYISRSDTFTLNDRMYAFEDARKVVMNGVEYDFKDIIGVSLVNRSKTLYTAYTTVSSENNLGMMTERALLGKMVAGDVGAIIGAMSTEENYEYETEYDSEIENDYKVYVNIDSISSPTVVLHLDWNEEDAYEITNLLNVIIRRNGN